MVRGPRGTAAPRTPDRRQSALASYLEKLKYQVEPKV